MLAVRLDPATEDKLSRLARETGRSKTYYVKQAIDGFLEEREDYLLALAVLERNEPTPYVVANLESNNQPLTTTTPFSGAIPNVAVTL